MKKKLKHLLWIKLAFVSLLFCSISLLTAKVTENRRYNKSQKRLSQLSLKEQNNRETNDNLIIKGVLIFFSFFSNSNILFFFLKIMRSQSTIILINNIPLV